MKTYFQEWPIIKDKLFIEDIGDIITKIQKSIIPGVFLSAFNKNGVKICGLMLEKRDGDFRVLDYWYRTLEINKYSPIKKMSAVIDILLSINQRITPIDAVPIVTQMLKDHYINNYDINEIYFTVEPLLRCTTKEICNTIDRIFSGNIKSLHFKVKGYLKDLSSQPGAGDSICIEYNFYKGCIENGEQTWILRRFDDKECGKLFNSIRHITDYLLPKINQFMDEEDFGFVTYDIELKE